MSRARTGCVETYAWRDGKTVTFRARIHAYGKRWRVDFGTNREGWNEQRARAETERILDRVARGTWHPPGRVVAPVRVDDETLHVFASRWWQQHAPRVSARTRVDYEWRLAHLLDELHCIPVSRLSARDVDRYIAVKTAAGLSPRSVNMTVGLLAQILDTAVEYELLARNPARGRRRRVPAATARRGFLEADQVVALLEPAGVWRPLVATLALAGPRIGEALALRRSDLDLPGGRLRILDSKTPAGARMIELTAFLHDELAAHAANRPPGDLLFATRTGRPHSPSNVRRALRRLAAAANRGRDGLALTAVTPHSLRRTFVSLALAAGRDPRWVMAQVGHADARVTLSIYAQVMSRQRVDQQLIWTLMRFPGEPDATAKSPTSGTTSIRSGA